MQVHGLYVSLQYAERRDDLGLGVGPVSTENTMWSVQELESELLTLHTETLRVRGVWRRGESYTFCILL